MRSPSATTRTLRPAAAAALLLAALGACQPQAPSSPSDASSPSASPSPDAAPHAPPSNPSNPSNPSSPSLLDLSAAQQALDSYDWPLANALLNQALEQHPQHPDALALLRRAEAEAQASRRIQEAIDLFNGSRFDDAELKLGGVPPSSVYFNQREEILTWITHAQAFPTHRTRTADAAPMRRVLIGPFPRGADDADVKFAAALCKKTLPDAPCKPEDFSSEQPQRQVYVNTFYIDTQETSNLQYSRCVTAGACSPINWQFCASNASEQTSLSQPDLPQVCVTWLQADAYCRWVDARLPTEAEWEKAAKGPSLSRFPWGDLWNPSAANWSDPTPSVDGFPKLAPPHAFSPNGFGLYHTSGNALEWTHDVFDPLYYKHEPPPDQPVHLDPQGPPTLPNPDAIHDRTVRGGSFESSPVGLRATARAGMRENTRSRGVGFRCAQSAPSD